MAPPVQVEMCLALNTEVFDVWCSIQKEMALSSHAQVAVFLLQSYQRATEEGPGQPQRCMQCLATLPVLCRNCTPLPQGNPAPGHKDLSHGFTEMRRKSCRLTKDDSHVIQNGDNIVGPSTTTGTAAGEGDKDILALSHQANKPSVKEEPASEPSVWPQREFPGSVSASHSHRGGLERAGNNRSAAMKKGFNYADDSDDCVDDPEVYFDDAEDHAKTSTGSSWRRGGGEEEEEDGGEGGGGGAWMSLKDAQQRPRPPGDPKMEDFLHRLVGQSVVGGEDGAKKRFVCRDCGDAFSRGSNLKRHYQLHFNYRPYQCPRCQAAFVRGHHLSRHVADKHYVFSMTAEWTERQQQQQHPTHQEEDAKLPDPDWQEEEEEEEEEARNTAGHRLKKDTKKKSNIGKNGTPKKKPGRKPKKRKSTGEEEEIPAKKVATAAYDEETDEEEEGGGGGGLKEKAEEWPEVEDWKADDGNGSDSSGASVEKSEGRWCQKCRRSFPSAAGLRRHKRVHSLDRPYSCKAWRRADSNLGPSTLETKNRTTTPPVPYMLQMDVEISGEWVDRSVEVETPTKPRSTRKSSTTTPSKTFICDVCGQIFRSKTSFHRHLRMTHGQGKPLSRVCTLCDKKFWSTQEFEDHVQTHFETKSYQCKTCQAKFAYKKSLIRHVRLAHSSTTESIQCEDCGTVLRSLRYLKEHRKIHQEGAAGYTCVRCHKNYKSRASLFNHNKKCR